MIKVLIACEFSGIVREAFKRRGFNAWSIDLLRTEIPGQHVKGNVLNFLDIDWKLMIAFPPCTYLANSGVRWLEKGKNEKRWKRMNDAIIFFNQLLNSGIERIAIENPIQHGYARYGIVKYNQIIHPWQFGHAETKATCLWLKNLPLLKSTKIIDGKLAERVHQMPESKNRWKKRSRTLPGIAEAMADQWGGLLL